MKRAILIAVVSVLLAGCSAGQSAFEDRSGEVWIKHRTPSK
jgi:hypothetical protein